MVGCDEPAIAIGTEILAWIETESSGQTDGTGASVTPACANRLRRVFKDGDAELLCDARERIQIGALSIKMNGQQRAQAGGLPGVKILFHFRRIEIEGVGVNINKNRTSPGAHDRTGGSEKTERGGDDGIAGLHSSGGEGKPQCVGAGRATDRMSHPKKC